MLNLEQNCCWILSFSVIVKLFLLQRGCLLKEADVIHITYIYGFAKGRFISTHGHDCRMIWSLSSAGKDVKHLCHLGAAKWPTI